MDKKELFKLIPDYYSDSDLTANILNALAIQFSKLQAKYENANKQLSIHTADTDIYRWEQDYGTTDNKNYSLEYRIAAVLSRIKGQVTITREVLEDILLDYAETVNIDIHNKEFWVGIDLETKSGFSKLIDKIIELIFELIPADFGLKVLLSAKFEYKNPLYMASTLVSTKKYQLSSDFNLNYLPQSNNNFGSNLVRATNYVLTNNIDENFDLDTNQIQGSTQINAIKYELS